MECNCNTAMSDASKYIYTASATCIPPPSGCPVGGTWNQTNCTCEGGTYTPPPPMTGTGCTSSQWWDSASSTCKTIDMGGQPGMYPAPITNMPACAPGVMPTAATPCMMPPPPSCPSGQWYDYSKSACTSGMTGTMPTPVNNVQCTPPMQSFSGPNGQSACYDPATLPTCSSTVTSTCKPQGWVAPTTQPVMNQYPRRRLEAIAGIQRARILHRKNVRKCARK